MKGVKLGESMTSTLTREPAAGHSRREAETANCSQSRSPKAGSPIQANHKVRLSGQWPSLFAPHRAIQPPHIAAAVLFAPRHISGHISGHISASCIRIPLDVENRCRGLAANTIRSRNGSAHSPYAMSTLQAFSNSCKDAQSYPQNLLALSVDATRSRHYQRRLSNPASRLCMDKSSEAEQIEVSFRDWIDGQPKCQKSNLFNDSELALWIGNPALSGSNPIVPKPDPKCRFMFLSAPSGRDALKITTNMLRRILSYHQVPAQYLEFLFLFGERDSSSDLKFGHFWSQRCLGRPNPELVIPALNRSGQHYELCFNLKGVEPKRPDTDDPAGLHEWSIRHAAIYHKFDVIHGTTVWTITKAKWNLKDRFRNATGDGSGPDARTFDSLRSSFSSSLAAHLLIARWAGESWWPYLQCLENELEAKTKSALLVTGDDTFKGNGLPIYTRNHLQEIIYYEEMATQAELVLKTNITILRSLRSFYKSLLKDQDFPIATDVSMAVKLFDVELEKIENELENLESRAKYLVTHAENRKGLVLNLMQAQNSDNMTDMTKRSIEEAIVMRIITVVTLVFLPATFVSTFFSTDVVKYQPGGEEDTEHTQYSSLALSRWLEVTLPLTLVTCVAAIGLYLRARHPLKVSDASKV